MYAMDFSCLSRTRNCNALETESLAAFASPCFFWNLRDHSCPTLRIAVSARANNTPRGAMAESVLTGRVH